MKILKHGAKYISSDAVRNKATKRRPNLSIGMPGLRIWRWRLKMRRCPAHGTATTVGYYYQMSGETGQSTSELTVVPQTDGMPFSHQSLQKYIPLAKLPHTFALVLCLLSCHSFVARCALAPHLPILGFSARPEFGESTRIGFPLAAEYYGIWKKEKKSPADQNNKRNNII